MSSDKKSAQMRFVEGMPIEFETLVSVYEFSADGTSYPIVSDQVLQGDCDGGDNDYDGPSIFDFEDKEPSSDEDEELSNDGGQAVDHESYEL